MHSKGFPDVQINALCTVVKVWGSGSGSVSWHMSHGEQPYFCVATCMNGGGCAVGWRQPPSHTLACIACNHRLTNCCS